MARFKYLDNDCPCLREREVGEGRAVATDHDVSVPEQFDLPRKAVFGRHHRHESQVCKGCLYLGLVGDRPDLRVSPGDVETPNWVRWRWCRDLSPRPFDRQRRRLVCRGQPGWQVQLVEAIRSVVKKQCPIKVPSQRQALPDESGGRSGNQQGQALKLRERVAKAEARENLNRPVVEVVVPGERKQHRLAHHCPFPAKGQSLKVDHILRVGKDIVGQKRLYKDLPPATVHPDRKRDVDFPSRNDASFASCIVASRADFIEVASTEVTCAMHFWLAPRNLHRGEDVAIANSSSAFWESRHQPSCRSFPLEEPSPQKRSKQPFPNEDFYCVPRRAPLHRNCQRP